MTPTASIFPVHIAFIIPAFSNEAGKPGTALQKYSLNPRADAAMGAENPTMKDTHPLKNPNRGLYSFERNRYSPPASGIAAPSSPYERAPQMAMIPPITHNTIIRMG